MYRIMTAACAGALALVACTQAEMPQPQDDRALYMQYCAACHGPSGTGGGELAEEMGLAAADLTRIAARNDGTFPRAQVLSKIDGYTHDAYDGPGMPEFGALLQGDLIPLDTGDGTQTPTPRRMVALLEYLESIQTAP